MRQIADSHIHFRFARFDQVDRMLNDLAAMGVTDACLLALPYRGAAENLAALYWKMHCRRINVRAFGGLHLTDRYAAIAPEVQARALLDMGCDGFKIMSAPPTRRFMKHGYNDMRYDKMFSLFEERGIPLNIHVADPEEFWDAGGVYADPSFPSKQQMYDEIFEVLDRHPGLEISFAHFFFLSNLPDEAERVLEKYPNVRFDLTPGVEMYYNFDRNIEYWRDFFIRHSRRILFGTDSNTTKSASGSTNQMLELLVYRKLTESHDYFTQFCYGKDFVVRGLDLPEEVVQRICYQNTIDFVGTEKKPVDPDMFYACCERILHDLKTEPHDPYYIAGVEIADHLKDDPQQTVASDFCRQVLNEKTQH